MPQIGRGYLYCEPIGQSLKRFETPCPRGLRRMTEGSKSVSGAAIRQMLKLSEILKF